MICNPSYTLSFSETAKGWTSFVSYHQESGLSLNNSYYTFKNGHIYEHHINPLRNRFYDTQYNSHVTVLFNDQPGIVKSFKTLNYEGSQARNTPDIHPDTNEPFDSEYYNNFLKSGWYVEEIFTNLQSGDALEFKSKEGKWFSKIKGESTYWEHDDGIVSTNIDTREFSFQGIGNTIAVDCPNCPPESWDCVDGSCVDPYTGNGQYSTYSSCINSCVPAVPPTYNCVAGVCTDPLDGTGQYTNINDCQANCYPSTWECVPGAVIDTSSCQGTTYVSIPSNYTWLDFGIYVSNPANGFSSINTEDLGACLQPTTGPANWVHAHHGSMWDWITSQLVYHPNACSCGDNNDGYILNSIRFYIKEYRIHKEDPLQTKDQFYFGKDFNTAVLAYTNWDAFITILLQQQPTLPVTSGVSDYNDLVTQLDIWYANKSAADPDYTYVYELNIAEPEFCDCARGGSVTYTSSSCIELFDGSGSFPSEIDCLNNCTSPQTTSWDCIPGTPGTPSTLVDSCDGVPLGPDPNGWPVPPGYSNNYPNALPAGTPMHGVWEHSPALFDYLINPNNGYQNIDVSAMIFCMDKDNHGSPPWTQNCDCAEGSGTLWHGPAVTYTYTWQPGETNPYPGLQHPTLPNQGVFIADEGNYTTVVNAISQYVPAVTLGMTYGHIGNQITNDIIAKGIKGQANYIFVQTPCLCSGDPGIPSTPCSCVERQDTLGAYADEQSCLASCCGVTSGTTGGTTGGTTTGGSNIGTCDWRTGGRTTGQGGTFGTGHVTRPNSSLSPNGGTVIHDAAAFFSTTLTTNTRVVGSYQPFPPSPTTFPGWRVDDSYFVRRAGSTQGDIIQMPSGRCWEFVNNTFPPQATWVLGTNYPQQSTNAGSYYGPYQVPYWHSYIGKNPEEPGNEDWWSECSCS